MSPRFTPTGGQFDRVTRMSLDRRIERAIEKGHGLVLSAEDIQRFKETITSQQAFNEAGKRGDALKAIIELINDPTIHPGSLILQIYHLANEGLR